MMAMILDHDHWTVNTVLSLFIITLSSLVIISLSTSHLQPFLSIYRSNTNLENVLFKIVSRNWQDCIFVT
jgi:hypothetical protein